MIKIIARKILNSFGLEINRKRKIQPKPFEEKAHFDLQPLLDHPLDSNLHLQLSLFAKSNNNFYLALAELKTANFLGLKESTEELERNIVTSLPDVTTLNHNVYFRLKSLGDEIRTRLNGNNLKTASILDIGGGQGDLAAFIPEMDYCLAEPIINGINGFNLPFKDESFDLVVSCHVLEHIPLEQREVFLDQLLSKSKQGVILLNPIEVEGTYPTERIQLVIDVTDAEWAKEHLDCILPTINSIQEYAEKRNLIFDYSPNSSITMTLPLIFFDYLSSHLPKDKYHQINKFFNTRYTDIATSEKYPTAGMFFLGKR